MEQQNKTRTLKVRGKEVEVSEEIYRAYIRPIRAEQRQKRREWKCQKLSKNGNFYVRCKDRCETCPYYLAGNTSLGNITSLDKLIDKGVEMEDIEGDLESNYIEQETLSEEYSKLHEAIEKLTLRQQKVVRMIYFEEKTLEEVADFFGVTHQAISKMKKKIIKYLKTFF